jgi:GT2 family glycosyltransferase
MTTATTTEAAQALPTSSVLIPSFRRPASLRACLDALARQTTDPTEVLVVWQADDTPTRDAAVAFAATARFPVRVLHSPERGVVPAENLALGAAVGEVILLIDDDAVAPPGWVARHLAFYADPTVGAVGGPADNFNPDGSPFPRRAVEPVGRLTWYGRERGNLYDHVVAWRSRPPAPVDSLAGYNMSLRRAAFERFDEALRPYWSLFELDACLQVASRGYRVMFDYGNVVGHHPTNTAYVGGRDGDLDIGMFNPSYNQAYILARWSPPALRPVRLLYLMLVGSRQRPGLFLVPASALRYGRPLRELRLLRRTLAATLRGWADGSRVRRRGARPGRLTVPRTVSPGVAGA